MIGSCDRDNYLKHFLHRVQAGTGVLFHSSCVEGSAVTWGECLWKRLRVVVDLLK